MKITRIDKIPDGYEHITSDTLTDVAIATLEELGCEEIRYWYGSGCYEGSGHLLMLKDGKWYHHDMGHCSCYGPVDNNVEFYDGCDTIEELLANCSKDLRKDLEPLAWS